MFRTSGEGFLALPDVGRIVRAFGRRRFLCSRAARGRTSSRHARPSSIRITPEPITLLDPVRSSITPPGVTAEDASPPAEDAVDIVRFSEAERRFFGRSNVPAGGSAGAGGAVALLGLEPTTLHAKMKKLGIRRPALGRGLSDRSGLGAAHGPTVVQ
jgi:hypothetical protein